MTVTNYFFNFGGPDAPADATVNWSATGSTTLTLTENGVNFTFSAQAGTANSNFSSVYPLSVSSGTVTLTINDTPDEEFFSNLVFDFSTDVSGTNSIQLIRTKTPNGAATPSVVTTIPNSQITPNAIVTAPAGQWNQIKFISSSSSGAFTYMVLDGITATINCFLQGTSIATPDGETPVETLQPGDLVRTADGGQSCVRWVAVQSVDPRLTHPKNVNPICIRAGALGEGMPKRDLYLTNDHAVDIGGVLYTAGALVNGRSIYQVAKMPLDQPISYYHVETERHELLLAEGVPSETFIDYVARDGFDNAEEAPDSVTIAEMDLIRVSAARLVPDHIKAFLAERAEKIEVRAA